MKCEKCDSMSPEGVRFCGKCGARLQVLCPKCGASIYPSMRFCGQCGYNLEQKIVSGSVCHFCALGMPFKSRICPHCGSWRIDISQSRNTFRMFFFMIIFPIIAFIIGYYYNWWATANDSFSTDEFVTSISGEAIIGVSTVILLLMLYYYYKTSRKLGTWVSI